MQERVGLYALLRALYTYPLTPALLEAMADVHMVPGSPLSAPLREMQASLPMNGALAETTEALNIEMTRLLEGPGVTPAPPYGSYYLHGGRLAGPSAWAVHRAYLDWCVVPERDTRLPDDHLALEFGFLAHLAQQAIEAGPGANAVMALVTSQNFIRNYLLPWLPRFCAAMANATHESFFVGLAHFSQAAVEADFEWLTTVLAGRAIEGAGNSEAQD
jgi:TorA maturation chaperone TorD